VLEAYFDESYNHRTKERPNDPLVGTIACWISTDELWKKFTKRWRKALSEFGIDSFHMKDYEARQRAFRDWRNDERIERLKQLHRIMRDQTVYGCSMSINIEDFENKVLSEREFARYFGRSWYAYGVRGCIKQLAVWCNESSYSSAGPVRYVFGEYPKQASELDRLFSEMLTTPVERERYRVDTDWVRAPMKEVVPLQAADIIAYELNKRAVNSISGGPQFVRKSLDNLHLSKNFSAEYFDKISFVHQINKAYGGLTNPNTDSTG
jgi:hypothetical protein